MSWVIIGLGGVRRWLVRWVSRGPLKRRRTPGRAPDEPRRPGQMVDEVLAPATCSTRHPRSGLSGAAS